MHMHKYFDIFFTSLYEKEVATDVSKISYILKSVTNILVNFHIAFYNLLFSIDIVNFETIIDIKCTFYIVILNNWPTKYSIVESRNDRFSFTYVLLQIYKTLDKNVSWPTGLYI